MPKNQYIFLNINLAFIKEMVYNDICERIKLVLYWREKTAAERRIDDGNELSCSVAKGLFCLWTVQELICLMRRKLTGKRRERETIHGI